MSGPATLGATARCTGTGTSAGTGRAPAPAPGSAIRRSGSEPRRAPRATAGAAGAGKPGQRHRHRRLPGNLSAGHTWQRGAVCGRCWPPTVVEPSGARSSASGPDLVGGADSGNTKGRGHPGTRPGSTRTGTSGGERRRLRGRRGRCVGQLGVQRRRRNAVGRLGRADHHPVAGRVLDQVGGVPGRDHALLARRFGQRRCGFRLAHIAFQRLLLLLQHPVLLAGVAQLVGTLGGVGGQPQREAQPETERTDDQHDERDFAQPASGAAGRSTPAGSPAARSDEGG